MPLIGDVGKSGRVAKEIDKLQHIGGQKLYKAIVHFCACFSVLFCFVVLNVRKSTRKGAKKIVVKASGTEVETLL